MSKQTISTITDKVMEGTAEWQNRPLDRVYPVVFIDAIVRREALLKPSGGGRPSPRGRRSGRVKLGAA